MFKIGIQIYLILTIFGTVKSYHTGAPDSTCDDMTPQHGFTPKTSAAPYSVDFDLVSLQPGGSIKVTIKSNPGIKFRGFMIKSVDEQSKPVGTFTSLDSHSQTMNCDGYPKGAITHTDGDDKSMVTVQWNAPTTFTGSVQFLATYVQTKPDYWVAVQIPQLVTVAGTTYTTTPQLKTTVNTGSAIVSYSGCGETKGCFADPTGCEATEDCRMFLAYTYHPTGVEFELITSIIADNPYIAMGLSDDVSMGDDGVTYCFSNSVGKLDAYMAQNIGYSNKKLDNPQQNIHDIQVVTVDGTIQCKFTQDLISDYNGKKINLVNNSYYLFIARGKMADDEQISQHSDQPAQSGNKVNITNAGLVGSDKNVGVIVHGCLMITAWLCTTSIAIFLARFYKQMWPDVLHCKVKVWFAWHRGLNTVTVLFSTAAFILIFVTINGWSQAWRSNPHPILGCITFGFMCIQPVMAFFRPHPGTPRRPIFNWAHYIVGMSSYILAIVTIFFAKSLHRARLPDFFVWIMIAFVGFVVIMFVVMEVFACMDGRVPAHNQIAMKDYAGNGNGHNLYGMSDIAPEPQGSRFKEVMLVLFLVGVTCFTAALIVVIAMSPFPSSS